MNNGIKALQSIIDGAKDMVFFGGAGVSTASGIPDFRSAGGLYYQQYDYPPETVISREFYHSHKDIFYRFYRERILCLDARPNAAHYKLAELEAAGKLKAVITQNIDGLHQAAGSKHVLELHGSVFRNHCQACGKSCPVQAIVDSQGIPRCWCGGDIKPDVVLYGESLDGEVVRQAIAAIRQADVLLVGGTSLVVYPAAGFLDYFRGDKVAIINKSATGRDSGADLVVAGDIAEVFGAITV